MPDKLMAVVVKIDGRPDKVYTLDEWLSLGRLDGLIATKEIKKGEVNEIQYPMVTLKEFNELRACS